jgi:hypothetical protein
MLAAVSEDGHQALRILTFTDWQLKIFKVVILPSEAEGRFFFAL